MRAWRAFARFGRDRSGASASILALFSAAMMGFTAIGVDGANFFQMKRRQQAATDLAAMAAAETPGQAQSSALSVMAANGFANAALQVTPGIYTPDPALNPAGRFAASPAGNAVKLVSTTLQPFFFGGALQTLLGGTHQAGFAIRTTATAQKQDLAAFTLGTGLAAVDNGLLNAVLGGLLGTHLSLSLLDYQSLAAASVDLFQFSDALRTRMGASAPTYGALAASTASESVLLASLADTLQGNTSVATPLRTIATAAPSGSVQVGRLIDYGSAGSVAIGTRPLTARVGVLDLLMAVARLGGNGSLVAIDLGTTVPSLGSTQLLMTLGEPAVGSAFAAIGSEGATLHSAQVRLLLTTQIGATGLVPAAITVPFYLEIAPGTATIASIACSSGAASAGVGLTVAPGLADAWIGTLAPSSFGSLSSSPSVSAATLLTLAGVVRITALGHATAASPSPTTVPFSAADIRAAVTKTTSAGVSLSDTMASLAGQTAVSVTALGFTLPQPGLPAAVTSAIGGVLVPVDQLLAETLALLGVSLGNATTSVSGVRCGQGQLVN